MQYENGCWLLKKGYAAFWPTAAYEVTDLNDRLKIYAPTQVVSGKGDTLGGINLTIEISAPFPEMFRVTVYHHKGIVEKGPYFPVKTGTGGRLPYSEDVEKITVHSGSAALEIHKSPFSMSFLRDGKVLCKSNVRDLCYIKQDWQGYAYDHPGNCWMSQRLSIGVDELLYGLGERFGPLVKNGQSIVIENKDGGTSSAQSYKNIPFYLSSRGYGVFVNHPETVEFEVGTEQVSRCGFSVEGEKLEYYFINGPTMKDVLVRYTDLTGKPALPPQWSFGLWLSTSFTTDYDTATVESFVDGMLERGIPLSVFHFDCCWMREFHWSDFTWDSRVFQDPKGLIQMLHRKNIKVCLWINPYIAQESCLFAEAADKGYLLHRINGDVWQWDMWQPGLAIVDFTNPAAVKWYQAALKRLLDMGVDCFKTDFGERIPVEDVAYFDGSNSKKMHNYYTYLYNQAVFDLIKSEKGAAEALVFARSATAGSQVFPVHWGGDCWSDYDAMAQSLRGGLSFISSGFGFWAHDIGGFEETSTADVYKRWLAFGLLSTHSRLHGSSSYRVPWLYDEEAVAVCRFFTRLKLSLLPYLYSSAYQTSKTGIPMIRSMAMSFEEDRNCRYLDKQYMLGDSLLIAPIFNDQGMASYYLPKGKWFNYLTGEVCTGGVWRQEYHDYLSVPLWVRENAVIPVGVDAPDANYCFAKNMKFRVFGLEEESQFTVYQDGKELMHFAAKRVNGQPVVTTNLDDCSVEWMEG